MITELKFIRSYCYELQCSVMRQLRIPAAKGGTKINNGDDGRKYGYSTRGYNQLRLLHPSLRSVMVIALMVTVGYSY